VTARNTDPNPQATSIPQESSLESRFRKPRFEQLLGNGHRWGLNLSYAVQPAPEGLAQAFIIGKQFLSGSPSALILDFRPFGSG